VGLGEFFAGSVSARNHGVAKPDPSIFLAACAAANAAPHQVMHLGDDPLLDIDGALAAGLQRAGSAAPTARIRTPCRATARIASTICWKPRAPSAAEAARCKSRYSSSLCVSAAGAAGAWPGMGGVRPGGTAVRRGPLAGHRAEAQRGIDGRAGTADLEGRVRARLHVCALLVRAGLRLLQALRDRLRYRGRQRARLGRRGLGQFEREGRGPALRPELRGALGDGEQDRLAFDRAPTCHAFAGWLSTDTIAMPSLEFEFARGAITPNELKAIARGRRRVLDFLGHGCGAEQPHHRAGDGHGGCGACAPAGTGRVAAKIFRPQKAAHAATSAQMKNQSSGNSCADYDSKTWQGPTLQDHRKPS
jgi:hypothetical protein